MENLLSAIKSFLDIIGTDRDEDLTQIIKDGLDDMYRVGILTKADGNYTNLDDPQIIGCIKLYARYMVNYGGDAERYAESYRKKRDALSLHEGYHA